MTASSLRRFGATAIMFLAAIIASATAQDSLCVYDCAGANGGEYPLPPLGYGYDSLEPNVNNETMTFHHDVHFAGYTRKMNAALEELNQMGFDGATSVADMLANIGDITDEKLQTAFRNNGGVSDCVRACVRATLPSSSSMFHNC